MTQTMTLCLLSIFLPLAALAMPGDPDKQDYCVSLASKGDCDFYNTCIETWTRSCGSTGYALGYGGKYCRKFGDNQQLFNEAVICSKAPLEINRGHAKAY